MTPTAGERLDQLVAAALQHGDHSHLSHLEQTVQLLGELIPRSTAELLPLQAHLSTLQAQVCSMRTVHHWLGACS